jgi:serine protease Do
VSAGIISGKGRELAGHRQNQRGDYLQTDAAINPGNSGGPLVNLNGEVIGINTAIASNNGAYQGVGFALPSEDARWVSTQLIENGEVRRAYLGIRMGSIDGRMAKALKVRPGAGLLVAEVIKGSPAEKAGLQVEDIITHVNGKRVSRSRDLQSTIERAPLGSTQQLSVLRDGQTQDMAVVVEAFVPDVDRLADEGARDGSGGKEVDSVLGMEVAAGEAADARRLGVEEDQIVIVKSVEPDGLAASVGLEAGMAILKVGDRRIQSVDDFREAMQAESLAQGIRMRVLTEQGLRFIVIQQN